MEFLSNYGWAIMVTLVVIAALATFGVLDPKNLLPDACLFQPRFQCTDSAINSPDLISFAIINNYEDIKITNVIVDSEGLLYPCQTVLYPNATETFPLAFHKNEEQSFEMAGCKFSGSARKKTKYFVNITYLKTDGFPYQSTIGGEILAKLN
ncbi:MAG: hypothetical protein AABX51_01130 [Nanoarchaeota archaeon]